jgi:hypothetical protein
MRAEAVRCLRCPSRLVSVRGLCARCYGRCCKLIRRGQATWAQLEQAGSCLPAAPRGQGWRGRGWVGPGK